MAKWNWGGEENQGVGRIAASGDRAGGPTDLSRQLHGVSTEGAHPLRGGCGRYLTHRWGMENMRCLDCGADYWVREDSWESEPPRDSGSDPEGENGRSPVECEASQSGAVKQAHRPENPAYFWLGIQAEGRE